MKYLLDTDTCIFALRGNEPVLAQLVSQPRGDVAISVVTEAELRTGAAKSSSPIRSSRQLNNFLGPVTILDFTSIDAVAYAQIRARLERAGTPIGMFDGLIAAHAVARKLVLVSNNEREFGRVPGLRIENWS